MPDQILITNPVAPAPAFDIGDTDILSAGGQIGTEPNTVASDEKGVHAERMQDVDPYDDGGGGSDWSAGLFQQDVSFDSFSADLFDEAAFLDTYSFDINLDTGADIVVTATREQQAAARDGSFYGGIWVASVLGAGASGGGGESHGSAGVGLGVGFEIGYSSDSGTAADEGDNTNLQLPTDRFDFDLDLDPFTFSLKVNGGIYLPVIEKHNEMPRKDDSFLTEAGAFGALPVAGEEAPPVPVYSASDSTSYELI